MLLERKEMDGVLLVSPTEPQLTINVAGRFRTEMDAILDENACLLAFDFSRLDYIDSLSLGVIMYAANKLRDRGKMVLFGVNGHINEVFRVAGCLDHLHIEADQKAALEAIKDWSARQG